MTSKATYKIFGAPWCKYCQEAKELVSRSGFTYEYINLEESEEDMSWFLDQGFKTVPQIYCEDRLVGGFTELAEELGG